jgi:hypothetical protein
MEEVARTPKPKRASDYYTRLEMQWLGMCEAVLAIDPAAWDGIPAEAPACEVTTEVTTRVTGKGPNNEKPPTTLEIVGGTLEREKGFEPGITHAFSDTYAAPKSAQESSTRLPDASVRVSTEFDAGDTRDGDRCLPVLTPDLFINAGVIVAEHAGSEHVERTKVEEILRRALDQAAAASGRWHFSVPPIP